MRRLMLAFVALIALGGSKGMSETAAVARAQPDAHLVSVFARDVRLLLSDYKQLMTVSRTFFGRPETAPAVDKALDRLRTDISRLNRGTENLPGGDANGSKAKSLIRQGDAGLILAIRAWRTMASDFASYVKGPQAAALKKEILGGYRRATDQFRTAWRKLQQANVLLGRPEGTTRTNPIPSIPPTSIGGASSLAHDFAAAPSRNPVPDASGHATWSLLQSAGEAHDPTSYTKLPRFLLDEFGISGLNSWQGDFLSNPNDYLPQVGVNISGAAKEYKGIEWPAGAVLAHPLADRMAVIGWRSPLTGTVTASGTLKLAQSPNCGNGIAWSLDYGSHTIDSGVVTTSAAASFQETVPVGIGQALYLTIDANQHDYYCDSTLVTWTVRSTATP